MIRAAIFVVLACSLLPACISAPERGYYAPAGAAPAEAIVGYREETEEALLDVRCQGVYLNEADGREVLTVHVQLEIARPRTGNLVFPWEGFAVDVSGESGNLRVPLSACWSGRERLTSALVVPSWSRRPFDLFFDFAAPGEAERAIPERVLLRWQGRVAGRLVEGQCQFRRLPAEVSAGLDDQPAEDLAFGRVHNGYYLPGRLRLGPRELLPTQEERLHYVFHQPLSWWEGWL
ncbi:MAG: hypothetical protein ACT4PU_01025 [Planctomycetota bacterium]